jgi:hypothetical protein
MNDKELLAALLELTKSSSKLSEKVTGIDARMYEILETSKQMRETSIAQWKNIDSLGIPIAIMNLKELTEQTDLLKKEHDALELKVTTGFKIIKWAAVSSFVILSSIYSNYITINIDKLLMLFINWAT